MRKKGASYYPEAGDLLIGMDATFLVLAHPSTPNLPWLLQLWNLTAKCSSTFHWLPWYTDKYSIAALNNTND